MSGPQYDLAIVGGGLSGGLVALALAALRPDLSVALIDGDTRFGGNHMWSFFDSDVAREDRWLVDPLVIKRWKRHAVRFSNLSRTISIGYNTISSERLDQVLRANLPEQALFTGTPATQLTAQGVTLADGRQIRAGAVIDARGSAGAPGLTGGWQKFIGRRIRTGEPHGVTDPIIMDARLPQRDGYRFLYLLPLGSHELFIEDTYYAPDPTLDHAVINARIDSFCQLSRFADVTVLGQEEGVLPVVAGGDYRQFMALTRIPGVARIGARAALYHPLTSYSLPTAVAVAVMIARSGVTSPQGLERLCADAAQDHWRASRYYRFLARLMMGAGSPGRWFKVFRHFYTKDAGLIARFYGGQSTRLDKLRLLIGKPPVPVMRALGVLIGRGRRLAPLGAPDVISQIDGPALVGGIAKGTMA